jgi:hypothetical protein
MEVVLASNPTPGPSPLGEGSHAIHNPAALATHTQRGGAGDGVARGGQPTREIALAGAFFVGCS